MSREDCDYAIDKSLATGELDKAGNLAFRAKGTREEIVGQIMETAGAWGQPMTREQAKAEADAEIAGQSGSVVWLSAVIGAAIFLLVLAVK
jgi:hypothetical protein